MKIQINRLKKITLRVASSILIAISVLIVSCSSKEEIKIEGAGASFPYPLYSQLFDTYAKETGIKVNYQSIGSGGGIKQITARTVDFGATDAFVKDKNLSSINSENNNQLLHIPIVLGGVSITYNVSGLDNLQLDGETLASIFMGKVNKWNDPAIISLNPGKKLSGDDIIVVRRSDGSGTTSAFSSFLAHVNDDWERDMGVGKSLSWFNGSIGAKGNEGVTGQLQNIPYSIGYVSLNYAVKNNLPVVAIENSYGNFVKPSVRSVSLSANTDIPADTRIDLTVLEGDPEGYPISTFTWMVFYQEQNYNDRSKTQAEELKNMLYWMISPDAQNEAAPLYYAPLPSSAIEKAHEVIDSVTYDGDEI